MRKITAILFLFIYLFFTTGIYELFKFNALMEHFEETRKQDSSISFSQFLLMHYVTDDNNSNDNDEDRQLPYKSPESYVLNSAAFCFPVMVTQMSAVRSFIITNTVNVSPKNTSIISRFKSSIWHPPKVV